jgi:hypothetical protein
MSPLAMIGSRVSDVAHWNSSWRARRLNLSSKNRTCSVMASIPASSIARSRSTKRSSAPIVALPRRIFTVSGPDHAARTCASTSRSAGRFSNRRLPASSLRITGA